MPTDSRQDEQEASSQGQEYQDNNEQWYAEAGGMPGLGVKREHPVPRSHSARSSRTARRQRAGMSDRKSEPCGSPKKRDVQKLSLLALRLRAAFAKKRRPPFIGAWAASRGGVQIRWQGPFQMRSCKLGGGDMQITEILCLTRPQASDSHSHLQRWRELTPARRGKKGESAFRKGEDSRSCGQEECERGAEQRTKSPRTRKPVEPDQSLTPEVGSPSSSLPFARTFTLDEDEVGCGSLALSSLGGDLFYPSPGEAVCGKLG